MNFIDKYPGETLRALSWKQPFCSAMLHDKVETRVWPSRYFGWVLLCASKAPYAIPEFVKISGLQQGNRLIEILGLEIVHSRGRDKFYLDHDKMPLGQAIAVGKLSHSYAMGGIYGAIQKKSKQQIETSCFVQYNEDLFMHEYTDVQPIVPFDWKGTQGWSTVSEEVKSKIILL